MSMLEPLEKIVLITQRKESGRRPDKEVKLLSFSPENGVDMSLPGCPAAVDVSCIHFPLRTTSETLIPLQRQSHKSSHFSVNSCSILTNDPSIESSRPQVFYSNTKSVESKSDGIICVLSCGEPEKTGNPTPVTSPAQYILYWCGPDRREQQWHPCTYCVDPLQLQKPVSFSLSHIWPCHGSSHSLLSGSFRFLE